MCAICAAATVYNHVGSGLSALEKDSSTDACGGTRDQNSFASERCKTHDNSNFQMTMEYTETPAARSARGHICGGRFENVQRIPSLVSH
jgi:hypothetical protein